MAWQMILRQRELLKNGNAKKKKENYIGLNELSDYNVK